MVFGESPVCEGCGDVFPKVRPNGKQEAGSKSDQSKLSAAAAVGIVAKNLSQSAHVQFAVVHCWSNQDRVSEVCSLWWIGGFSACVARPL